MKCEACGKYSHLLPRCRAYTTQNGEGRKRSVSPPTEQSKGSQRNQSRPGRGKEVRHTVYSVDASGQKDNETHNSPLAQPLEEGEIPPDVHQDVSRERHVRDGVVSSENSEKGLPITSPPAPLADSTVRADYVSLSPSEDPRNSESEEPVLLVNHQRCGRKVAKSI